MTLTPEQQEHAEELIRMGEKLQAVRFFQDTLGITADQALVLAEKLEQEIESSPLLDEFNALQEEASRKPGINVGRLVGTIFMSLGGIMLAVVAYLIVSNYNFAQRAIPIKGKVIKFDSYISTDDEGRSTTMFRPTFEYTYAGKTNTYPSSTSSSSPGYEINDMVDVLVDPDEPEEILIDSFWERWFLPVLLGVMGTMFGGMGYLAFRLFGKHT